MNAMSGSILPIAVLVAAFVYGIATHRRWLWIPAGCMCAVLLIFLLLFGLGHGVGGVAQPGTIKDSSALAFPV